MRFGPRGLLEYEHYVYPIRIINDLFSTSRLTWSRATILKYMYIYFTYYSVFGLIIDMIIF